MVAAAKVRFPMNARESKVLTVPTDLPVDIRSPRAIKEEEALLPRCEQFRYLGGLVPSVQIDLRHRRVLAVFRSVQAVLQSAALPDLLRGWLFAVEVETVLRNMRTLGR
jgi:hypothetical protein